MLTQAAAAHPIYLTKVANGWLHGNSVQLTPDGNILYSARHQDWIIKIDYQNGAGSGKIIWRLGKDPAIWDGNITVSGGSVSGIEGWRFADHDFTDNLSSWKLTTHRNAAAAGGQLLENGIIVEGSFPSLGAALSVETRQGNFSFVAREIVGGGAKNLPKRQGACRAGA